MTVLVVVAHICHNCLGDLRDPILPGNFPAPSRAATFAAATSSQSETTDAVKAVGHPSLPRDTSGIVFLNLRSFCGFLRTGSGFGASTCFVSSGNPCCDGGGEGGRGGRRTTGTVWIARLFSNVTKRE